MIYKFEQNTILKLIHSCTLYSQMYSFPPFDLKGLKADKETVSPANIAVLVA